MLKKMNFFLANHGCVKTSTPLIEYLKKRKEEKRANILVKKNIKKIIKI